MTGTPTSKYTLNATNKTNVKNTLKRYGYNDSYLDQLDDDDLMELLQTAQDNDVNYSQRTRDRQDTMTDFAKQLNQLTGSKQRQAEQAGRIAQNAQRTQGLASMMQNF